jgi:hypothetical protein
LHSWNRSGLSGFMSISIRSVLVFVKAAEKYFRRFSKRG